MNRCFRNIEGVTNENSAVLNVILLSIIDKAGSSLLALAGSLNEGERLSTRLTRYEVNRQFRIIAENSARLPPEIHIAATPNSPSREPFPTVNAFRPA